MSVQQIKIDLIDIPAGRRVTDPDWEIAIGEDIKANGQKTPIEILSTGERFRLIFGGHRLGGMKRFAFETILADVKSPDEFANEAAIRLSEIKENFLRRQLTVLDQAFDVAAWRDIYEAAVGEVKRGRKAISRNIATNSDDDLLRLSEQFAGSFTEAAKRALKLSRDGVFRALKIAAVGQSIRERISLHSIADNQSELLALAAEPALRREAIVNLLLASPAKARSVADAIAIVDKVPPVARQEAWLGVSDKFSKLPEAAKRQFILEHWDFIETVLAERKVA